MMIIDLKIETKVVALIKKKRKNTKEKMIHFSTKKPVYNKITIIIKNIKLVFHQET